MRCPLLAATAVVCLAFPGTATAQEYSGTFSVPDETGGIMTVTLQQATSGTVAGTLSSSGSTYQMQGQVQDGILVGSMSGPQGGLWFEAQRWGDELRLTLFGSDAEGEPDYDDYTEIELVAEALPGATDADGQTGLLAGALRSAAGGILSQGARGADPYVGTFSDGSVVLELQGANGQYQGQVTVGGAVYPVTASGGTDGLQGWIEASQQTFPMTVSLSTGGVMVAEGGVHYDLRRGTVVQGGAVSQPGTAPTGVDQPPAPGRTVGPAAPGGVSSALASGFTFDHPLVTEWQTYLEGRKLTRLNSYSSGTAGGYSTRTDVYLCSDRSFAMRDESSVSVDVGGAFGNSGGVDDVRGTWYVITNGEVVGLILETADGRRDELRMEYLNEETYANGERVYVTSAEICY